MKRLTALLLALILPVCAMAETFEVTLQVQTAEALFSSLLDSSIQLQQELEGASVEAVAKLMQALLGNTKITVVNQSDADAVSISLNGKPVLDMTTYMSGSEELTTSSLIPGYVLVEEAGSEPAIDDTMEQKIAEDIMRACNAWADEIREETAYGAFTGDAYSGGTACTTWTITDREVSKLVSAVMTPELRNMIKAQADAEGADAESIVSAIDAANERVSEENKYTYEIRCVKDDKELLVGLSLTVFEQDAQIATFSLGKNQQEIRVVVGFGLKKQNYWAECILTQSQRADKSFIKGEAREWTADKDESFAYVKQTNAPVMSYLLNCIVTKPGQRMLWDGHVYLGMQADAGREVLSFSGSVNKANRVMEAKCSLLENKQPLMTFSVSKKPAAAIQPPDPALVRCSATDPEQGELYTKVSQDFAFAITMRLMQIIPFEAILMLEKVGQ